MDCYKPKKVKASKNIQWLLQKLYSQGLDSAQSDLLSQILFDRCYTARAENLGYLDAQRQHETLLTLLDETP